MKAIIIILLALNSFLTYGQNITLNQFVDLSNGSLGEVEEFLSARKWEIHNTEKDVVVFMSGDGVKTSSITFLFNLDGGIIWSSITFVPQEGYLQYLEDIKKLGCTLVETKIIEDGIFKTYSNDKYKFGIRIIKADEATKLPIYTIKLSR